MIVSFGGFHVPYRISYATLFPHQKEIRAHPIFIFFETENGRTNRNVTVIHK